MEKYVGHIKDTLGDRELLEQLAEECAELAKAALKCIRAAGMSNNPTPVTLEEAGDNLIEEFRDICCVMYILKPCPELEFIKGILSTRGGLRGYKRI